MATRGGTGLTVDRGNAHGTAAQRQGKSGLIWTGTEEPYMRQPWKLDRASDSTTVDVAVVIVFLFGHMDGEERAARNPGGNGASGMVAPGSRFGSLTWG
jgi:hypothetical protein